MTEAKAATDTVRVRREGRTAWVTLDRPPLNVIDVAMMHALGKEIHHLTSECDFIIFDAAGEKGFSAGVEINDHLPERVSDMLTAFHGIFRQLWRAECTTIAAVHGYCLGGGCELATFCDFVVAEESAQFGVPEIRLGCFPPVAMVTFPCLVGHRAATELILTGRIVSAEDARNMGLITRLAKEGELRQEVNLLLSELNSSSRLVYRLTRRTLWQRAGMDFEKGLHDIEEIYRKELMHTEDAAEGIRAYLENRAPVWKGR